MFRCILKVLVPFENVFDAESNNVRKKLAAIAAVKDADTAILHSEDTFSYCRLQKGIGRGVRLPFLNSEKSMNPD